MGQARADKIGRSYTDTWTEEERRRSQSDIAGSHALKIAKDYFKSRTMRKYKCCICGCQFWDWTGCNPAPIVEDDDKSVCCHDCDRRFVIPVRLAILE